jgi:hypothetical protein
LNVKAEAEAVELRTQITTLKEQLSTAQGAAEANVGGAKQAKDLQAAKEWLERRVDELQSEMAIKVAELEGELAAQTARATEAAERVDLAASEHTAALAVKQAELTAVHDQGEVSRRQDPFMTVLFVRAASRRQAIYTGV